MGDNIRIVLAEREVIEVEDYTIKLGVFEQPGGFDVTIGRAYPFRYLAEQFPPKTPYELYRNDTRIQVGLTDGFRFAGGSNRTAIHLRGRDPLGWLVDNKIKEELSFTDLTFAQLTEEIAKQSGLVEVMKRFKLGEFKLTFSNEANRQAITGTKWAKSISPTTTESVDEDLGPSNQAGARRSRKTTRGEVGTSYWQFLVKQYRRVGIFLFCAADGTFVLSTPSIEQNPIGRLFRKVDVAANITDGSFENDTTQRCSEFHVYGRGIGNKSGVGTDVGRAFDDEMVAYLNPREEDRANGGVVKIVDSRRDDEAESIEQASNLARREISERRRAGWKLSYEIASHSIDGDANANADRVYPMPDCVVDVDDDDFGVYGKMYVESVTLTGKPRETKTTLSLLRDGDLFFKNETVAKKKRSALKPVGIAAVPQVFINAIGIDKDRWADAPGLNKGWEYPVPSGLDYVDRVKTPEQKANPELTADFSTKLVKGRA